MTYERCSSVTIGGVEFPVRSVRYSDGGIVGLPPRLIVPEPIEFTVEMPVRAFRRFMRPFAFTCRKCQARAEGRRPTTRAHHHRCQRRGRPSTRT